VKRRKEFEPRDANRNRPRDGKEAYAVKVKCENGEDEHEMTLDDLKKGYVCNTTTRASGQPTNQPKEPICHAGIAARQAAPAATFSKLNHQPAEQFSRSGHPLGRRRCSQLSQSESNLYAPRQARQQVSLQLFRGNATNYDANSREQAAANPLDQQEMAMRGVPGNQGIATSEAAQEVRRRTKRATALPMNSSRRTPTDRDWCDDARRHCLP